MTEPLLIKHVLFHPSGNPKPSRKDKEVTNRLVHAGQIIGVPLQDHIIVGDDGDYVRLREEGYIK
ncbi:JAB domain-containing protein [Niallia nealsonii]|uniref:DNA repair protein RadC n=1 Tax=Niallia nealsonii TaxID=115979 RepID=A0A2N0YZM6_9BACI|nr:JAB domain-containing protein [Niallia nealsonii]PKG22699.1 DNA repair protein RadC [Niallia nealsonii]